MLMTQIIMLNCGICMKKILIGSNYEHGLRRRNSGNRTPFCISIHPSSSMENMEKSKHHPILLTTMKEQDTENVAHAHGKDLRIV